jgi:hypothetical protein
MPGEALYIKSDPYFLYFNSLAFLISGCPPNS